jgi:hypothetical protein
VRNLKITTLSLQQIYRYQSNKQRPVIERVMEERKKEYLKIHIAVDVKSKKILLIKITTQLKNA